MKKYQLGNLEVSSLRSTEVYDERCKGYREKHTIKISNGKINKYFTYTTEVIGFIDRKNFYKNVLYSIYSDYLAIENNNNEMSFIEEYGYNGYTYEEGKKIYKACLREHDRFAQLINSDTLEILDEVFDEY